MGMVPSTGRQSASISLLDCKPDLARRNPSTGHSPPNPLSPSPFDGKRGRRRGGWGASVCSGVVSRPDWLYTLVEGAARAPLGLVALGGLSAAGLWGYLLLAAQRRPGPTQSPLNLFLLPLIAGLAWAVNTLLGLGLRRRAAERPMAYLLFGATLFAQALVWAAAVSWATASR